MDAVRLDPAEVRSIGNAISAGRPKRLFEYLAANPNTPSKQVIQNAGVTNLSQVARLANETLFPAGVMVGCIKPLTLGSEPGSQEHLWSVFRVKPAANDKDVEGVQDAENRGK